MTEEQDAYWRHAKHYLLRLRLANDLCLQGRTAMEQGLARFDREWPHIRQGQHWASTREASDTRAVRLCCEFPEQGLYLLDLRLTPSERITWWEAGLAAAEQLGELATIGRHAGNLGNAYSEQGEIETARSLYTRHLDLAKESGHQRGEANALGNLANLAYAQGKSHEARDLYIQVLALQQSLHDVRGAATTLVNLGAAASHWAILPARSSTARRPDPWPSHWGTTGS